MLPWALYHNSTVFHHKHGSRKITRKIKKEKLHIAFMAVVKASAKND